MSPFIYLHFFFNSIKSDSVEQTPRKQTGNLQGTSKQYTQVSIFLASNKEHKEAIEQGFPNKGSQLQVGSLDLAVGLGETFTVLVLFVSFYKLIFQISETLFPIEFFLLEFVKLFENVTGSHISFNRVHLILVFFLWQQKFCNRN